jgi:hypothetical protein
MLFELVSLYVICCKYINRYFLLNTYYLVFLFGVPSCDDGCIALTLISPI